VHICFFNRSYWPDQAATGQLLSELAEDLVARHGCEVTVVAGRAVNTSRRRDNGGLRPVMHEAHHGVRILRANGTRFRPRRFAGRAANYLTYLGSAAVAARQVGRPDVVVALTDPPVVGLTALWTARRSGARFVFLCEDVFPEVATLLDDFHNAFVNRTLDRINRRLLRDADAVVALGDRMRRRLVEEKGADPSRLHVIHNWADCEAIVPGPKDNTFSRSLGIADQFVFMHSGNIGHSQNLDVLVAAADRLRSRERLTFLIVGEGARRTALEAEVARRRLTNVKFADYQPKADLHESFAAADAFLVALKPGIEGFIVPSKLYGILAAGRPYVAATDPSCEAAEIIRRHHCGLLARPGDPDDLAEKIVALYEDPAATRAMGVNARAAALRFDRRHAVASYHDLFLRLMTGARAA
jgi:putative colanic acid biosynthesis glycosyltransferase WcaI